MLVRRNTEGSHSFSDSIDTNLCIFDMQGLLLNNNWQFTAAIEAFELPVHTPFTTLRQEAFGEEEKLYVRARFATQVGVPFFVLLHKEGDNKITIYDITANSATHHCECRKQFQLSESAFIEWWHERKQTNQTKPYRKQFEGRVEDSYFDSLLESNDLKWGGNIDGYFVSSPDSDYQVEGIVEKRYTTSCSLYKYNPANYFKDPKDPKKNDYNTWKPLFLLKERLSVPLYLFTYSRLHGEQNKVGVTILKSLSRERITYLLNENNKQITPNSLICNSEYELRQRLQYLRSLL